MMTLTFGIILPNPAIGSRSSMSCGYPHIEAYRNRRANLHRIHDMMYLSELPTEGIRMKLSIGDSGQMHLFLGNSLIWNSRNWQLSPKQRWKHKNEKRYCHPDPQNRH